MKPPKVFFGSIRIAASSALQVQDSAVLFGWLGEIYV